MKKLVFSLLVIQFLGAQNWQVSELHPMPLKTSNNSVTLAYVGSEPYVYSFGGIDSTKIYSGIHLSSFRYQITSNTWESIPDLPDTLGKIATGASTVKNKIYIIGGYHVLSNGNELSSNKTHIYNPNTNSFEPDGASVPVPVDDHVQLVWRDSLIYIITGWSNTTNVANVQIYNPSNNVWSVGTSVPNNNLYKCFGANGYMVGDTIYYYGGASTGLNFPAQNRLRMGIINPSDPTQITWSSPSSYLNSYRSVITIDPFNNIHILGGSKISYNYNGIAYNGSGGVQPNHEQYIFHSSNPLSYESKNIYLPMDLRGYGELNASTKFIVGGMDSNQTTTNRLLRLDFINSTSVFNYIMNDLIIYPNPTTHFIHIQTTEEIHSIEVIDPMGKEVKTLYNVKAIDISNLPSGVYNLEININYRLFNRKIIKE